MSPTACGDHGNSLRRGHSAMNITLSGFGHKLILLQDLLKGKWIPQTFSFPPSPFLLHMRKTCIIGKGLGTRLAITPDKEPLKMTP